MKSFGRGSAFELLTAIKFICLFELFLTIKYYFLYYLSYNIDLHFYAVYTHPKLSFLVHSKWCTPLKHLTSN